ncbi:hypothetical protein BC941DRAFT_431216 [Chlamydoabsidia padenii]|nr:hypothetical protein BC941DRAFT_431216 [Chlamydoabsidia padenii]
MLPVRAMYSLVGLLPQLHQLSLRYCDLVHTTTHYLPPSSSVTRLECYWTNIPKAAVAPFLSGLPLLTQAKLLANHNRHVMANNHLLAVLPRTCPAIDDLEVGLQEIGDDTVVGCLQRYGSQLQRLSLRSSSVTILHAIQLYTPWVQDLTLRLNTREEEDDGHMLVSVLSHCHRLERVQVDALPPILRQALGQDENKRYHGTKLETMIKDRLEKTFVLDHDQLTGIRSLAPL